MDRASFEPELFTNKNAKIRVRAIWKIKLSFIPTLILQDCRDGEASAAPADGPEERQPQREQPGHLTPAHHEGFLLGRRSLAFRTKQG